MRETHLAPLLYRALGKRAGASFLAKKIFLGRGSVGGYLLNGALEGSEGIFRAGSRRVILSRISSHCSGKGGTHEVSLGTSPVYPVPKEISECKAMGGQRVIYHDAFRTGVELFVYGITSFYR